MKMSDDEIRKFLLEPLWIPNYPSHSQSVERAVKLVSECCRSAYSYEERHKLILSKQAARKERQSYETKKQYRRIVKSVQTLQNPNM